MFFIGLFVFATVQLCCFGQEALPPVLVIGVNGTFKTNDNSFITPSCATQFSDHLSEKGSDMVSEIINRIGTELCVAANEVIVTSVDTAVNTYGSMGYVTFDYNMPGRGQLTMVEMILCGDDIAIFLSDFEHWGEPIIPQFPGCPAVTFVPDYFEYRYAKWTCPFSVKDFQK